MDKANEELCIQMMKLIEKLDTLVGEDPKIHISAETLEPLYEWDSTLAKLRYLISISRVQ